MFAIPNTLAFVPVAARVRTPAAIVTKSPGRMTAVPV
jgi:hypothetical protein